MADCRRGYPSRANPGVGTGLSQRWRRFCFPSLGSLWACTDHRARFDSLGLRMADPLSERLKEIIIETLRLEDITVATLKDDEPLIGSGLSLDSIDALELVVRMEKEFGVKIGSSEESRKALASISSLAAFVRERADPARLPR